MLYLGCDVGSLTAKAALYNAETNTISHTHLMRVKESANKSSREVITLLLEKAGVKAEELKGVCATGYGRFDSYLSAIEKSEISCHGLGAHWSNPSIRTIIDIGGQDSKAIAVDEEGMVVKFIMNDKCAAGTGRVLELLSEAIDSSIDELGKLALKGKGKLSISNRCSVFMEQDVLLLHRAGNKKNEIAFAITDAVAERVKTLAKLVGVKSEIAISGGVSKNPSIVKQLEKKLGNSFVKMNHDPQLMGAIGAALFAAKEDGVKIVCAQQE